MTRQRRDMIGTGHARRRFPFGKALLALAVTLTGVFAVHPAGGRMFEYVAPPGRDAAIRLDWETVAPTPMADKKYTPQGMTFINGDLLLAESWADTKTVIYVMRHDAGGLQVRTSLEMPAEAVHTSGLCWDGEFLWAVDYVSHVLYKIDWAKSLAEGRAAVVASTPTGLAGSGSVARLTFNGTEVVAVSDFMNTARTYFVPLETAFGPGSIPDKSIASYRNAYFVQGLMYKDGYLYETANAMGKDLIFKIDPRRAVEADDFAAGIVGRFTAPSLMVEDIAYDGKRFWTSDESSFNIYRSEIIE